MIKALITGISGQDGSYLAELLLSKDYTVHGLIRRSSTNNLWRIEHLIANPKLTLHYGDMSDGLSLSNIIRKTQPDEIYNLAALSQVRISYDVPASTADITAVGFARLLEAVRLHVPDARVYQASSSEMFGKVQTVPQNEQTPFYPRSPYGCSKTFAFYLGRAYREGYGLNVSNGILFNHESPRRGDTFLSMKVVQGAVAIKQGRQSKLHLGNLEAQRDWGSAKEYVEWIWKILQHPESDDFVIATGETHSVQEFVEETFNYLGMDWRDHVEVDQSFMRPAEVDLLLGDYAKAKRVLGFEPKVRFKNLIAWMVDSELMEERNYEQIRCVLCRSIIKKGRYCADCTHSEYTFPV